MMRRAHPLLAMVITPTVFSGLESILVWKTVVTASTSAPKPVASSHRFACTLSCQARSWWPRAASLCSVSSLNVKERSRKGQLQRRVMLQDHVLSTPPFILFTAMHSRCHWTRGQEVLSTSLLRIRKLCGGARFAEF